MFGCVKEMSEEEPHTTEVVEDTAATAATAAEQTAAVEGGANPKETDCIFWQRGECTKGNECPFKHDPAKKNIAANRPICKYYAQGYCEKGKQCPFRHVVCHSYICFFNQHCSSQLVCFVFFFLTLCVITESSSGE